MTRTYAGAPGGHPGQTVLQDTRPYFGTAHAVIPASSLRDIVTSRLPGWDNTRAWILARPLTGFAETFAQLLVELAPGGGSDHPEPDPEAEAALFVLSGEATLTIGEARHELAPGSFAWAPPGTAWTIRSAAGAQFQWIRKAYEPAPGVPVPAPIVTTDAANPPHPMPDTEGRWATTRFMDVADMGHDMHITIVTLQPGGTIPFLETHVMEHGLYVLEGKGAYRVNDQWVEVGPGDFLWLRAFCPQACYAGGPGPFRYLLYKDMNRHPKLRLP